AFVAVIAHGLPPDCASLPPLLNPSLPQKVRNRNPAAVRSAIVVRAHLRERLQQPPEFLSIAGQSRRLLQRAKVASSDHAASSQLIGQMPPASNASRPSTPTHPP